MQSILKTLLILACALIGAQATALELSDLSLPMKRSQADAKLTKDYTYSVMVDGTVRRTWVLDGKTVFIDFNTSTDDAILICINYKKPVSKKEGIKDAHILAKGKLPKEDKWETPKDPKAVAEFGLTNPKWKRLSDRSMLFYEPYEKGNRIARVSVFATKPHNNRWTLEEADETSGKTAMGNQWGRNHIQTLLADEKRRQAIPNGTSATATDNTGDSSADTEDETDADVTPSSRTVTTTASVKPVTRTAPAVTPVETADTTSDDNDVETTVVKLDQGRRRSKSVDFLAEPPDWLKKVGIEEPTWWHYGVLAAIVLLLVIFIFRAMSHSASNAAQQKRFSKVVSKAPKKGNFKIKRQ